MTRDPSLLDEIQQREVCAIVSVGGTRRTAAKYVGCAVDTIRRTAECDRNFCQRLKKAESDLEVVHLSIVQQAAKKNWRASVWLLERIHPERFGRRGPRTVTAEQVTNFLSQVVDMLLDEVYDTSECDRIVGRLEKLTLQFQDSTGGWGANR